MAVSTLKKNAKPVAGIHVHMGHGPITREAAVASASVKPAVAVPVAPKAAATAAPKKPEVVVVAVPEKPEVAEVVVPEKPKTAEVVAPAPEKPVVEEIKSTELLPAQALMSPS